MATRKRITAKEKAYEFVKCGIINETFKQGNFLTEEEVAQQLGISRTPVREAFLLLAAEGLINIIPQKGAFIPPISSRDIEEIMEIRELIELFAAEKLLTDSEAIQNLQSLLIQQEQLMNANETENFIYTDREFHNVIVSASGNNMLITMYESLRDKQFRIGMQADLNSPQRMQEVLQEHSAIVVASIQQNIQQLKFAIRKHLNTTLSVLLKNKR